MGKGAGQAGRMEPARGSLGTLWPAVGAWRDAEGLVNRGGLCQAGSGPLWR